MCSICTTDTFLSGQVAAHRVDCVTSILKAKTAVFHIDTKHIDMLCFLNNKHFIYTLFIPKLTPGAAMDTKKIYGLE